MHLSDSQLLKQRARAKAIAEAAQAAQAQAEGLLCLLTPCHPERALSRALIQHLAEEMRDITFTLRPTEGVSAVWICGYEPGAEDLITLMRQRYPEAVLIVTGRDNPDAWRDHVLAAGADHAAIWPLPYEELSRLLHARRKAI